MIQGLLTIDDFSSKNTPALVDYLKENGIKAIFFATGANVERYYDEAMYALKNGMFVGNHSYSHPAFSSLTIEECVKEIEKCESVLDKLYSDCGVERVYCPFRFPYGDKGGANKDAIQAYLKEKGFHKVDDSGLAYPWWKEFGLDKDIDTFWSFDFGEYNIRPGSEFTEASVWERMRDTEPKNGASLFTEGNCHILLMHDHDETEEMVPGYYRKFLDALLEEGFVFVEPKFL